MAIKGPAFIGRITIGSNNTIHWFEENGGPTYNLSTTVSAGTYYPDDLAAEISTAMSTESLVSGATIEYSVTISAQGLITITGTTGTWYPKITTTETSKLLTGGDVDIAAVGDNHFGWTVDSGYPSASLSHTSDQAHSNSAYPVDVGGKGVVRKEDDEGNRKNFSISKTSLAGTTRTYSFGPTTRGEDYTRERHMELDSISQASRTQWDDEFWHAYAKQGLPDGRFRLLEDRTNRLTYVEYGLSGESLQTTGFRRSQPGLPWWSLSIHMKRYKA